MTRIRLLFVCLLTMAVCVSVSAQSKKGTRKGKARTTQVQKKNDTPAQQKTVTASHQTPKVEPKHKSLSDPEVVRYLMGGFAREDKLHLIANEDYTKLTTAQKQKVLSKVSDEFRGYDITIYSSHQHRELWLADTNGIRYLDSWDNDSLQMEKYLPLELDRQGQYKVFYYVGGTYSGGDGYSNGSLNLRVGSYLYRNLLDASVTVNIGYNKTSGQDGELTGDVGLDSRIYLPFRIKKINLAPYAGAGVSWVFAPDSFFEARALAGGCWFVGPGSLDIGLQYGTETDFAVTLGYTFRIPAKKKKK